MAMNAQSPTAGDFARRVIATTERLIEVGETWADLHAAAEALEETKKSVLGHLVLGFSADGMPTGKAEHAAHDAPEYRQHVTAMVEARRKANRARVRWDVGRTHADLMRSVESTKREEMRMR